MGRLYRSQGQVDTALSYQLKALSCTKSYPDHHSCPKPECGRRDLQTMGDHRRTALPPRALDG